MSKMKASVIRKSGSEDGKREERSDETKRILRLLCSSLTNPALRLTCSSQKIPTGRSRRLAKDIITPITRSVGHLARPLQFNTILEPRKTTLGETGLFRQKSGRAHEKTQKNRLAAQRKFSRQQLGKRVRWGFWRGHYCGGFYRRRAAHHGKAGVGLAEESVEGGENFRKGCA